MKEIPVALQLYSVREDCAKDLRGTLEALAEMGYDGVEFAGYYGLSAGEMRDLLKNVGLRVAGSHISKTRADANWDYSIMPETIEALMGDELEATIEFNKILGNKYLILPWLNEKMRKTKKILLDTVKIINEISEKLRPHGMYVGYHAEAWDFKKLEEQTVWDIFGGATNKDVIMQFDTGNAMVGGVTAKGLLDILKQYPGRSRTIHLKEHSSTKEKVLLGEGEVNWRDFLKVCEAIGGTEWYILEQENYPYTRLESVKGSLNNLKQIFRNR